MSKQEHESIGYRLTLTLVCPICELEWVPRFHDQGEAVLETGEFRAAVVVKDTDCPMCGMAVKAKAARKARMAVV